MFFFALTGKRHISSMVFPPSGRILGGIWFSYFSLSTLHLFRNGFFLLATVICQKLDYTSCNKELTLKLTEDIRRHLRTLRWPVRDMVFRDQFSCFKFQTYKLEILRSQTPTKFRVWKLVSVKRRLQTRAKIQIIVII